MQSYISRLKLSISREVAAGVFVALSGPEPQHVQFPDFIQNTCAILKGSFSQKSAFLCKACSRDTSRLDLQQLGQLLLFFVRVVLTSECSKTVFPQCSLFKLSAESSQRMISFLMQPLEERTIPESMTAAAETAACGTTVSASSLEEWMAATPLGVQILETFFSLLFYHQLIVDEKSVPSDVLAFFGVEFNPETGQVVPDRLLVPLTVQHPIYRVTFESEILDQSSLMLLNSCVPPSIRGRCYPLFSSLKHGESFSTFCKALVGCAGPTLLVIRDKDGHIFGGFGATKWRFDPNFTGDLYQCILSCMWHILTQICSNWWEVWHTIRSMRAL